MAKMTWRFNYRVNAWYNALQDVFCSCPEAVLKLPCVTWSGAYQRAFEERERNRRRHA